MIQMLEHIKELDAREELKTTLIDAIFRVMAEIVAENEGLTRFHYEEK
jgi:hypothetical protein